VLTPHIVKLLMECGLDKSRFYVLAKKDAKEVEADA